MTGRGAPAAAAARAEVAVAGAGLCMDYPVYASWRAVLEQVLRPGAGRGPTLRALHDVSFEVPRGEVLGVIGRNGAGKTTLMSLIAGTLTPTGGTLDVNGKVSAILALGTGFNLDLTGRENVLLGGLCAGMSHAEVRRKREAIIEFSGIGEAIDRPCWTYSTGMRARLAFSIASSVDPDILVVDEALATGDAAFVAKSYSRMRDMATGGATVLLVTHHLTSVIDLCDRAMLLDRGRIVAHGAPVEVCSAYDRLIASAEASRLTVGDASPPLPGANDAGACSGPSVAVLHPSGEPAALLRHGEHYRLHVRAARRPHDTARARIELRVLTPVGLTLFQDTLELPPDAEPAELVVPFRCRLNAGAYEITATQDTGGTGEAAAAPPPTACGSTTVHVVSERTFIGLLDLSLSRPPARPDPLRRPAAP